MNTVVKSLLSRRSVRAYMKKQVPMDLVMQVVEAGRYAPNGMHQEPWHFTVLRNEEKISALDLAIGGDGKAGSFYQAPTLIIVSIQQGNSFAGQDTGCAMTNMMQAAHALGLSSVWCNRISRTPGDYSSFGVPAGYVPTAILAVGYAAVAPSSEWKVREDTVTVVE